MAQTRLQYITGLLCSQTARLLGDLGDIRAVQPLIDALRDPVLDREYEYERGLHLVASAEAALKSIKCPVIPSIVLTILEVKDGDDQYLYSLLRLLTELDVSTDDLQSLKPLLTSIILSDASSELKEITKKLSRVVIMEEG